MNPSNDPFLQILTARFNQPGVIGLAITGSYSSGSQDAYSDIDLDIFVDALPEDDYSLQLFNEKLISVKYIRFADEYSSLKKPERAVWAVPGLRKMKILLDEQGEIAKLKQAAADFTWSPLQPAADIYAVEELMGCAEEAHKILSGLGKDNEPKVLYASWGMFKNLSFAALVQAGLLIETENRVFSIIEDHYRFSHPAWTRAFRLSFGMDVEAGVPPFKTRGMASLNLYEETAHLFKDIITDKHRAVIENTLQLISSFKQSNSHA